MKRSLIFVITCFVSFCGFGQEKQFLNESESEKFSERVSILFSENKVAEAFSEMSKYWPLPETELDLIKEKTVKGLNLMESRFGKSTGVLKIKHLNLKGVFTRDVYFVRYNLTVIRFVFVYYKNDTGWLLNSFEFDEDFEDEF